MSQKPRSERFGRVRDAAGRGIRAPRAPSPTSQIAGWPSAAATSHSARAPSAMPTPQPKTQLVASSGDRGGWRCVRAAYSGRPRASARFPRRTRRTPPREPIAGWRPDLCERAGLERVGLLRELAQGHVDGLRLAVADEGDGRIAAGRCRSHLGGEVGRVGDRDAVEGGDDVALLQARRSGGAVGDDLRDVGAGDRRALDGCRVDWTLAPSRPCVAAPLSMISSVTRSTMFDGIEKPTPIEPDSPPAAARRRDRDVDADELALFSRRARRRSCPG